MTAGRIAMNIYIFRHSKLYSSYSMFDEPHIYRDNYLRAEVSVLAHSKEEAYQLLEKNKKWDIEELKRIEPVVVSTDEPVVIGENITY